ncbi:unnamed protein product [Rangifer tarandus platyrhynchus]|uniref:Uncharacterized protein n=1 Tax=Rangifer tarandus platyrhynchus TaxID=3082113 RepID=A0AC59ZN91_RANTA
MRQQCKVTGVDTAWGRNAVCRDGPGLIGEPLIHQEAPGKRKGAPYPVLSIQKGKKTSCLSKAADLDHHWVAKAWLNDIGLSQYSQAFQNHLVDGRMLKSLMKRDLEKHLCVQEVPPGQHPAGDRAALPSQLQQGGSPGSPGPLRDTEHRPRGLDQPAGAQVGVRH